MPSESFAQCGNWRIHYTRQGNGPALILLHGGLPGTTGMGAFRHNVDALSQDFTVYVIDFPGWGKSSKTLNPVDHWADPLVTAGMVVLAFMDELGISRAHLMGGSFGAAAALHAAINSPEKVERLVLIAPSGGVPRPQRLPWPALIELLCYYDEEGPTIAKFESLARQMVFNPSIHSPKWLREQFQASLDSEVVANPPIRVPVQMRRRLQTLRKITRSPVLSRLLPNRFPGAAQALCNDSRLVNLQVPVLFIWGRNDQMQPIECLSSFGAIPHQSALLLDQCGHWPHREHSQMVNDVVMSFLTQ